jgi:hypothetical protein
VTARALWVAVASGAVLAGAGAARAESIFGMNLLGERMEPVDARVAALGGFVQIVDDSLGLMQYNPAMVAWAKRVTFGVAGYVTRDNNAAAQIENTMVASKFSTFAFAFPLYKKALTAAIAYRGRYDPDFEFLVASQTPSGSRYNEIYERTGGTWSVPFTLAADFGRYGEVGGGVSLERGTIDTRWIEDFLARGTADAVSEQTREVSATAFSAGAVVRPLAKLSLGVSWESRIDYDVSVDETFTNSSVDTSYDDTMRQPERWTVSAAWRATRGLAFYAGASMSDFTDFEGLDFPPDRLVQDRVAALGVEYRVGGTGFPIRVSARYEQLPYTLPEGEKITKYAFALGSGLLFRRGRGKLDAALQFGKVGAVDTNTYDDQQVRFYVSITGSEDWSTKRESRH